MKLLFTFVFLFLALHKGKALKCFDCLHINTDHSSSPARNYFSEPYYLDDYDHTCFNPSIFNSRNRDCPEEDGYVCGSLRGTISGELIMHSKEEFQITVKMKKCMKVADTGAGSGCSNNKELVMNELFKKSIPWIDSNMTVVRRMSGSVCHCTTSLCDPACGNHGYVVEGICIPKWTVPAVLGTLFGILLVSIASCCCCKCCRICCCYFCRKRTKKPGNIYNGGRQVGRFTSRLPSDCQPLMEQAPRPAISFVDESSTP